MNELVTHYRKYELTLDRKAFATVESHESYLTLHILPRWGEQRLSEVKTVAVEQWLDNMPFAPATKTKIRNIMPAVFSHGIRHEWITFNPISKVRCSAKRLVNLTCLRHRSSRLYCRNSRCVSVRQSPLRVQPAFAVPNCLRSDGKT